MSLVLNTNINSLVAQNALTTSGNTLATSLEQLSTGLRINTAADDAAGYAIVQGMTSQINGLNQAAQNANDGVSLTQTASGALTEITNDLQSMRDLAVESLNATNSSTDRSDLNTQFQQLSADIQSVATTTAFNGVNLLDGSFANQVFQIGANENQTINVSSIASAQTSALGVTSGFSETLSAAAIAAGAAGGITVTTTLDGTPTAVSLGTVASDASDLAAAINSAGVSGLSATAGTTTAVGTVAAATGTEGGADSVTINGTTINLTNTGVDTTNVTNAESAINAVSAVTGVSASVNTGGGLTLTDATGANITASFTAGDADDVADGATATDYGLGTIAGAADAAVTTSAALQLDYSTAAGTTGTVNFTGGAFGTGDGTSYTLASTGAAVSTLDVNTVADSNTALTSIDAALQQIATTSAQLGAYQNRFQAAVTGLNTTSTNLQSARSTIEDTDYAQATTSLSQAQILQQAGTAMVAQANEVPQNVLTLLQKLP